jgi:hypothetical protein
VVVDQIFIADSDRSARFDGSAPLNPLNASAFFAPDLTASTGYPELSAQHKTPASEN